MSRTLKRTAPFAVLATAVFWWACGPETQTPMDPLGDITPEFATGGVSGAAFTTFNPWVDGDFKEVCKNSIINCNIYGAKPDVWLNGGPTANGLGPDGEYFFAVLVPGGQPDPNDGGAKNLSDDFDAYTNRRFTVTEGEVSFYGGTHDLDSGPFGAEGADRKTCHSPRGCDPDGEEPLIRLFPFEDTTNPGGVYIMAICSLAEADPSQGSPGVDPRDCKYDAFKVKEGRITYDFMLFGFKFKDLNVSGDWDDGEPELDGWQITIDGTGFVGEEIHEIIVTGSGEGWSPGYWEYQSVEYTFTGSDKPKNASLTVCEILKPGWVQSAPASECYDVVIEPSGTYVPPNPLNFGNFIPEGCTPGFWQGGPDKPEAKAGGALLWDGIDAVPPLDNLAIGPPDNVDDQWIASGGANPPGNPYIHGTPFHPFFSGDVAGSLTMFELVDTGGGSENWRKAARSLVAAYLNASWGMSYPFTMEKLATEWADAVAGGDDALLDLHTRLDAANNAYDRDETDRPRCPISAGGL